MFELVTLINLIDCLNKENCHVSIQTILLVSVVSINYFLIFVKRAIQDYHAKHIETGQCACQIK